MSRHPEGDGKEVSGEPGVERRRQSGEGDTCGFCSHPQGGNDRGQGCDTAVNSRSQRMSYFI